MCDQDMYGFCPNDLSETNPRLAALRNRPDYDDGQDDQPEPPMYYMCEIHGQVVTDLAHEKDCWRCEVSQAHAEVIVQMWSDHS